MIIKAISLHQPWAWFIRELLKKYETRSWSTNYRGPLLICASKHRIPDYEVAMLYHRLKLPDDYPFERLPFGKAVCLVDLVDCILVGPSSWQSIYDKLSDQELACGNFGAGRYAWQLTNIRTFEPFAVRGRQGLFNVEVPDELVRAA